MSFADARPESVYQYRYRVIFPIVDDAGQLVSGAAGLTAQIATQASSVMVPAANTPGEIPTNSGMYYLDLTHLEMTTTYVAGVVQSTTVGARPTPFVFYPHKLTSLSVAVCQAAAAVEITLAATEPAIDAFYNGCYVGVYNDVANPAANGQLRYIVNYFGATRRCTFNNAWDIIPSSGAFYQLLQTSTALLLGRDMLTNPVPGGYAAGTAGQVLGSLNGRIPTALVGGKMDAWIAAGAIGTGAINANSIASGALTSPKFAADFLTASGLAADAVAEIQTGLSTLDATGVRAAIGMAAADLDSQLNTINTNVVTGYANVQARLPTTLDSGRMRCAVETMGVGTVTAEALADSAVHEMAGAVWDENLAAHLTPDSTGAALAAAAIGGGGGDDPWATLLPGGYAAGTAGHILGTRLDVAVSTRLATADYVLPPSVAAIQAGLATAAALAGVQTDVDLLQADVDDLQTRVPAALVAGRMPADVSGQSVGLTPAAVDAVWDEVIEGPLTVRAALRIVLAASAGRLNGAATPQITIRDTQNVKDRIVAAVDAEGNRSSVTLDGS